MTLVFHNNLRLFLLSYLLQYLLLFVHLFVNSHQQIVLEKIIDLREEFIKLSRRNYLDKIEKDEEDN